MKMKLFQKVCALCLALVVLIGAVPFQSTAAFAAEATKINVEKSSGKDSGVVLDGNLDEDVWKTLTPVEKQAEGTQTIDAGFNVTWDNNNMYLGVQVTGKTAEKTSFQNDSITYYLAPKNNRGTYSKDDFQVQISDQGTVVESGAKESGKNATLKVSDISVKYRPISNGYTMEIAMPWSVVGFVPQGVSDMGFDLMAFDGDSDCVMVWSGDHNNWMDTSNFGTLTFTGDGTEPIGQNFRLDRSVFAPNSEIGLNYSKAVDGDAIAVMSQGEDPLTDTPLLSKELTDASGRVVFAADENNLEAGDYDAVFYNEENNTVYARETFTVGQVKIWTEETSYDKLGKSDITVHYDSAAEGSWIGLYYEGDTPGSSGPSIVWRYTDAASGDMTFTTDDFLNSTHPDFEGKGKDYLRAGEYQFVLFSDGGYTVDQACPFTVTGPQLTLNNTSYPIDFNVSVDYSGTDAENNLDWVGIYQKGATPSGNTPAYAYQYAVGDSGSLTFTQQDVQDYEYSPLKGKPLPEGDYELILMADDGYDILDRTEFTVSDTEVYAPNSVSYDRTGARTGYADGKVTISDADHPATNRYVLYWGNENGKLSDYEAIDTVARTGNSTTYSMVTNTFIPQQATKLLVYGSDGYTESAESTSFAIPANVRFQPETPLYTFDVMSDTHIQAWDSEMNTHLGAAFQDIKKNDPQSGGIFVVGDMVDQGFDENYEKFFSIVDANKDGLPQLNLIMGNHEFMDFSSSQPYSNADDGKLRKWLNNTDHTTPYYDSYINGQHFIMMGSEGYSKLKDGYAHDYCDISETQFNWLRSKLAETKDKKQPIFLFLHQPMLNTVAGSYEAQGWNGVEPEQEAELRSILKDYPQVILFDGHTHWILQADHEMYDGKSSFASIFNTASVGYLWSDANDTIEGSQGLYVEVYKDKVLVKGRNYIDGTWIPKAFFTVDMNEKYPSSDNNGNTGGSHHDTSGSGSTTTPASPSIVTKTSGTGGTEVTVAANPDSAPVISGGNSSVAVTVPPEAVGDFAAATAQNPVKLKITVPEASLLEQLGSSAVHSVGLTVQVPPQAANNLDPNAGISIELPASVLQSAKEQKKDITLQVVNSQTGAIAYSWTFTGAALSNSISSVTRVNTAITVSAVQSDAGIAQTVTANSADHQPTGTVIRLADNGLLPAPASVKVYVGDKENCKPGSKVYLYYVNPVVNSLEQLPQSEYTVDAQGYLTFPVVHASDYVVLPKAAASIYPIRSDTTYPVGLKNGNSYTFAMTASGSSVPTFTVGNGKVFSGTVKRQGSRYYVTVKSVGKPGEMTAIYSTVPGQKPVSMCYLKVS